MFTIKDENKKIRIALLMIEIIFISASIFSVFRYGNSMLLGSLKKFDNDDVKYIRSAWNLIDNKILSYENIKEPTVYIMPGLTLILSALMVVFGKFQGIVAFKIFQAILQAASIYLLFLIGRKVFNSKVALAACIIDALYIVEIYTANLILMECIFKFLLMLLIYISIYAIERKSAGLYALGGLVWAAACLFRPTIAAYPIVILIMWIKNKYKFSDIVKYTILVLSIFCIIMAPWWVRNYKNFNRFILFTKSSGNPFLQGTFVNYDQSGGRGVPYVKGNNSIESDENEVKAGIQRLKIYGRKEPIKYIYWYTIGKTIYFWRAPFYWNTIFNISYNTIVSFHILILALGIAGMIKASKQNINANFLIWVIVYFNLIYLPFFTFARYSYPLMPLVIIFAAYSLNMEARTQVKS